jgi:hypothetical protein
MVFVVRSTKGNGKFDNGNCGNSKSKGGKGKDKDGKGKGGKGKGGWGMGFLTGAKKKEVVAPPQSVINIKKDEELDDAVLRFALYGGDLGGMTADELAEHRRTQAELALADAKAVAFRLELDSRKWHVLKAEEEAAEDRRMRRAARRAELTAKRNEQPGGPEEAKREEQRKKRKLEKAKERKEKERQEAAGKAKGQGLSTRFAWSRSKKGGEEEEEEVAETDAPMENKPPREQWIRIHNCAHNMSGTRFRSVVLLRASAPNFYDDPDTYFEQEGLAGQSKLLAQCLLQIRCKDAYTTEVHEIEVPGEDLVAWLGSGHFQLDLRRKFRRMKFGEFLISKVVMRYSSTGS